MKSVVGRIRSVALSVRHKRTQRPSLRVVRASVFCMRRSARLRCTAPKRPRDIPSRGESNTSRWKVPRPSPNNSRKKSTTTGVPGKLTKEQAGTDGETKGADLPVVTPHSVEDLRQWFRQHHEHESKALVIHWKVHTGVSTVPVGELIREALCWGWIDTTVKGIDADTYSRTIVKRKKTANWSANTLRYAEEMVKTGRMQPSGLAAYQRGKAKGPMPEYPKNPAVPSALRDALSHAKLLDEFMALAPSRRRVHIISVLRAKREETIASRIAKVIQSMKE